jgi:hypothetical protein
MPFRFVAAFLVASIPWAQIPTTLPSSGPHTDTDSGSIIVPQGTLVALKLVTTIKSKSTHPGDSVRAVVAFPLAIGTHVAIPEGAYVEGSVEKVNARAGKVQLRFTHLLYANGYTVPLVAINTQAAITKPDHSTDSSDLIADARDGAPYLGEAFAAPGQTNPQPPPLPSLGPSPGKIAAIGIGISAGITVLLLTLTHHHAASADYVLFDSGWQFQMALQEPLVLDAAQISAAA